MYVINWEPVKLTGALSNVKDLVEIVNLFFCNAVWAPSLPYPLLPCSLFVHPFPLSLPSHFSSLTQSGVTTTIITIALARSGIARLRTAT